MQFAILFVGVMVFVVYHFVQPPVVFNPIRAQSLEAGASSGEYQRIAAEHARAFEDRRAASLRFVDALHADATNNGEQAALESLRLAQTRFDASRREALDLAEADSRGARRGDINFVFLRFVMEHLPAGIVGLVLAAIFCASMGASSSELNALATTTIVDIQQRWFSKASSDAQRVRASRIATFLWGAFAVGVAQFAGNLGTLVERVNILGSLFYGTILGIFVVAFYLPRVGGTAVCLAAAVAEIVVLALYFFTNISFLWFNAAGCVALVIVAFTLQVLLTGRAKTGSSNL
jgi:hypothetical protein